ncbi:sensor histidine kinase [Brevibacillus reuszeri]|uniref:sensor histidine kinase n=1 Tax=Brevibacillus reuszeri TaxID=54915 RepID=UPI002897666A|nr:HAMP domain-containing sensor histidine kinase [Brevibacillus reuszeri]
MFEHTRKKLTLMYSGMLALILLVVFVGSYWIVSAIIHRNEQAQLESIAEKTIHEWKESQMRMLLPRPSEEGGSPARGRMDFDFLQPNQLCLIVSKGQQMLKQNPAHHSSLSSIFQQAIMQQAPEAGETLRIPLDVDGEKKIFVVYRPVFPNEDVQVYLAEDVSRMEQLLYQMRWAFFVIGILLLALTALIGYWFSGRAMIPINQSYKRQIDFTTDASHELRTPLSVILSSAEILQDKKESLPAFHQSVLQSMIDEIHRMRRLIDDLLTLARSDVETNQKLSFQPIALQSLIGEVAARMQFKAGAKEVTVINRTELDSIILMGHSDSIRQLFYILLDNAVKYSEQGGKVEIEALLEGTNKVVCSVQNYGNGIPEEDLPYVFERFYRADKARSRDVEGTGLGLAIAKQIVKMHKGQISVKSSKEQGTRFIVVLPVIQPRGDIRL